MAESPGLTHRAQARARARWRRRWANRRLRSKGIAVLLLPLCMLVASAAIFYVMSVQERSAQHLVAHARTVEAQLHAVEELVVDGETGIRGYLVTGNPSFLQPTTSANQQMSGALSTLETEVSDDAQQMKQVGVLQADLAKGYQLDPTSVPPASDATARAQWLSDQKSSTDAVRGVLAAMTTTEDAELAKRQAATNATQLHAEITVGIALAAGLAGGILAMAGFTRGVARRVERLRDDADRLHRGEQLGPEDLSDDELGTLSRRLHDAVEQLNVSNEQAVVARQSAEAANRAKSEFLSRMSHELRTPLNAVLGFAQLLEMDAVEDQRDSLRQIRRAGRHLLDLINEVLDISAIEAGQLPLSPEPVLVEEIVGEVVELMAPVAATHQVGIEFCQQAPYARYVRADRQRTKQILLNLLSNAVKYNNAGGTVSVNCLDGLQASTVRIDVADTGIGIPPGDVARLFTPFERLSAASTDVEGTGVGLALSLRLAEAMGGRLDVSSTVGVGSIFSLVLPLATALAEPDEPEEAGGGLDPAVVQGKPWTASPTTLLCIEDNVPNVRLLQRILLRRPNWRLVHAAQGQLGLELAMARPPDLILLDLHLPDMPGIEVLRRLKATSQTAGVKVIVVSADATPGKIERLRAAGADGYLTKPTDVQDVLHLLDRATAGTTGDDL